MKKLLMLVTLLGLTLPMMAQTFEEWQEIREKQEAVRAHVIQEKEFNKIIKADAAQASKQIATGAQGVNYLILSNQINEPSFKDVVQFVLMAQEDDAVVDNLLRAVDITHRPLAQAAALYPMVKNKNIDDNVKNDLRVKYELCNEKRVDAKTLAEFDEAVKVKHMQIMENMGRAKISPEK